MQWCGRGPDSELWRHQNRRTSRCGQTEQQHRMQLASLHWNKLGVSNGRARQASSMKWTLSLVIFVAKRRGPIGSHMNTGCLPLGAFTEMTGLLCQWGRCINHLSLGGDNTEGWGNAYMLTLVTAGDSFCLHLTGKQAL